jgi:hypothetical protein
VTISTPTQTYSSTKPLLPSKLVCSRKYHNNKKHKIPKIPKTPPPPNKTNLQTPNKRNFTHTQQEQLHKHPTKQSKNHPTREISQTPNKRFEANQHKVQIHKTPNKERIHNYPTRDLKLEILIANNKTPSLWKLEMSFQTMMMNEPTTQGPPKSQRRRPKSKSLKGPTQPSSRSKRQL